MAQTTNDLVNSLPKPETLEEQYMYALVCSVAGVTPKYGVAVDAAFKRLDQYWKAFWIVASSKFVDLETPGTNSVSTNAIRNNAVTEEKVSDGAISLDKLSEDVVERLWDEDRKETVTTDELADEAVTTAKVKNNAITSDKLANDSVTNNKIADGTITSDKIQNGTITFDDLDAWLQDKINRIQ